MATRQLGTDVLGIKGCVDYDARIAFGIAYFASEEEAMAYAEQVRREDRRYNGGFFDGRPCGRDRDFDYDRDGTRLYAVTR